MPLSFEKISKKKASKEREFDAFTQERENTPKLFLLISNFKMCG